MTTPETPTDNADAAKQVLRAGPALESTILTLAVLGIVVLLLSVAVFMPRGTTDAVEATEVTYLEGETPPGEGGEVPENPTDVPGGVSKDVDTAPGLPAVKKDAGIDCSTGKNGGSTDVGVSPTTIKLGASTVNSGPGASFLQPVDIAMGAVAAKVNRAGGICGRKLQLILRDSGWDAQKGLGIIQNLVQGEKVFAIAVNPDSEGLDFAHHNGYLEAQKIPVVGTDGLLISQYQDTYIFPIATPTASAMYAIAKSQCDSGLRKFSIVFETSYRFGREGAKAYNLAAKACTGRDIEGYTDPDSGRAQCGAYFCGILSGQSGYNSEARGFCKDCDAGAVLLEPATAATWFANGGRTPLSYGVRDHPGALGTPQPLFTAGFAQTCGQTCDQLRLWTGFNPDIEEFAGRAALQTYHSDMKSYSPTVDTNNQFVEGGYVGMRLMVDVLTTASSAAGGLTRVNLMTVLNGTKNWDIGLTVDPLSWTATNHFAQTSAHAFDEQYSESGFGGWRYTGIKVKDPNPSAVTKG